MAWFNVSSGSLKCSMDPYSSTRYITLLKPQFRKRCYKEHTTTIKPAVYLTQTDYPIYIVFQEQLQRDVPVAKH